MSYSIIAAIGKEREIGIGGKLPSWHLPDDIRRFKDITSGHTIIVGRKTYESLKKQPLPNRRNIVISRRQNFNPEGVEVTKSIEEALSISQGDGEIFIIGGAEIYEQTLNIADRMHLTIVDLAIPNADAKFPNWNPSEWKVIQVLPCPPTNSQTPNSTYIIYERRK